jgi:integrase
VCGRVHFISAEGRSPGRTRQAFGTHFHVDFYVNSVRSHDLSVTSRLFLRKASLPVRDASSRFFSAFNRLREIGRRSGLDGGRTGCPAERLGVRWAPNGGGFGATLWDAVRLRLLTGLRIAELSDLRVKDLVDNQTVVSVPRGKTRNARRLVPLPTAAQQVVALRMADLPDTSPDAPLWPELAVLKLTGSRGGKLRDRFRLGRPRSCRGLTAWISTLYGGPTRRPWRRR